MLQSERVKRAIDAVEEACGDVFAGLSHRRGQAGVGRTVL